MAEQIIIREYGFLHSKEGEANYVKSLNDLEAFILKNEESYEYLKITHKKGYGKVLQAQNFVGVIQLKDGTTIEILPKIADLKDDADGTEETRKIVVKMLRTLKDSPFKHFDHANLKTTNMPLLEIFISMFLVEVARLVQRGIRSDYIDKEENLAFLKGKLKFNEHIKQNFVHKERFYVAYQEFMSNRIENRLIKTCLEFLYKKSKKSSNQQRIREFLFVFDESTSHDVKNDFGKIKSNRQMKDYEQVLIWCKVFLLGNSFSPYKGDDVAFALLYDMNLLFESYVANWLKKRARKWDIKTQDRLHHLVEKHNAGKKFQLKPDIVAKRSDKIIIADTKWKIIDATATGKNYNISQSDMYQLYAYGKKYSTADDSVRRLYLIYPKNENFSCSKRISSFEYDARLILKAVPFDLKNDEFCKKIKQCPE